MHPSQQDIAKAESRMIGHSDIVLAIVDCISRTSACHGQQAQATAARDLQNLLTVLDNALNSRPLAQTVSTQLDEPPKDSLEVNSVDTDSITHDFNAVDFNSSDSALANGVDRDPESGAMSLDQMLIHLSSFRQDRADLAVVRNAAHQALGYRELQSRFADQLHQSKLQSIYNLAYGLSHELNNPLANIASRAGLLLHAIEQPDQRGLIQAIIDNAMRGGEMLGDLMLIARPPRPSPIVVSLQQLGGEINEQCARWAGRRKICLQMDWRAEGTASFDKAMLVEAVWCLVRNAIEASPADSTIQILSSLAENQLCIEVLDQGPGLSAEALRHCFDPYYSGREAGRGLGMGLAKAQRFARLLSGEVRIRNRSGRGCRASVAIPVELES